MPLDRTRTLPGMPGYWPKNENRYRYCNDFHDEGFRCTRPMKHTGPHAAHVPEGVEGSVKLGTNPATGETMIVDPGKTVNVQIATW